MAPEVIIPDSEMFSTAQWTAAPFPSLDLALDTGLVLGQGLVMAPELAWVMEDTGVLFLTTCTIISTNRPI